MVVNILQGFLHIVIGYGVFPPSPFFHEMVAETASMNDDSVFGEVVDTFDEYRLVFTVDDAVGEYLDDTFAILCIFVMEICVHTAHQVSASCLEVVQRILCRFQFDFVGDVQLFEDEFQQVYIITCRLTNVIDKRIRPQIPSILINQRVLFIIDTCRRNGR